MPVKLEPLDGGLHTAPDPVLAPDGTLVRAANARYRPGDPAIWQAEGRAKVGSGGHGGANNIFFARGLTWDPLTTVDGNAPEQYQLLYAKEPAAGTLYTVPAAGSSSDPAMDSGNATSWALPFALGPYQPDVVSFRNEFFLLSGSDKNHWVTRGDSGQAFGVHGMAENSLVYPQVYQSTVTGTAATESTTIQMWITWYDSVNDIEGAATDEAVLSITWSSGQQATRTFMVQKSTFDGTVPSNADSLRLYIGKTSGLTAVYPVGYRYNTYTVAQFQAFTQVGVSGTIYYLIPTLSIDPTFDPTIYFTNYPLATAAGIPFSRDSEPPRSTTGDVFEEALVLNDLDDPRKVWFSYPERPHSFPVPFFINFETKEADEVTVIRALGSRLGVYLGTSVWRVNWLPSSSDFSFNRGRVKDLVAEGKGAVSREAVTTFTHPSLGPVHAFVDRTGIYITDLTELVKVSSHLDWKAITSLGSLATCRLVDDPDEERLVFQVGPSLFFLHYDPAHIVEGRMAVTGPIERPGGVGTLGLATTEVGTRVLVSADTNTSRSMYYEARGFTEAADTSATLLWDVETKEVYPYGIGNEGKTHAFLLHMKPSNFGAGQWTGVLKAMTVDGTRTQLTDPISLAGRTLLTTTSNRLVESYSIQLSGSSTSASMAVNVAGVRTESMEEADSR